MEEGVLLEKITKRLELYGILVMVTVMVLLPICSHASSLNGEGTLFSLNGSAGEGLGYVFKLKSAVNCSLLVNMNFIKQAPSLLKNINGRETVLTGKALMSMKASFSNVANELLDWDDVHNSDFCSWRGVFCDNVSLSVVSLNLSNLLLGGEISPAIGDLRNLQSIDLEGNKLTGQIPDEIGNCGSLVYLDLSDNLLYADIPFSISKLKKLEFLNLKNNQLTGPIPSTLTQIPNLKTLDLARNQLTGEIPRLIYWNEVLQYLGLRGNMLTGTLSPDMCQLTGLCDVRGNNLTGGIPDGIGNCTSFEILDISYNQITGVIPYNIGFLQVATLSLQGNKLTGNIPDVIGLMQALAVLDLSENELVGPIPPILGNLSFTGKLYLHGNKLTGSIPPELGNMSKLSYLQLNDNQLVGSIPAELGKLELLFELNLANNRLEGPIPHNISSCTALNKFNVHGNRLNGSIPSSFQNLESLTYLNLSSNNFKGRIPTELGHIINLDTLDLSGNNFSGPIPGSIGGLEHLLTLNLSNNQLGGQLPAEFGSLRSIQIIDLSFNSISGNIPAELGQLQNIVSLILKNNKLQGGIPEQLTNCFSLANLFIGNPLLCGNWLGSICGPSMPKSRVFSRAAVVCMTLGFIALVAMTVLAIYKSNQPKQIEGPMKSVAGPPKLVVLHMDMAIHTFDDIMRFTENLSDKYIIGYGASSTVYKCTLKSSRPIAIKRLYTHFPNSLREFETELETIGSIRHRNIVSLHGYSLSPYGNLLFYDYMENGSLWDLLHGKRAVDNESNLHQLILSKADDNTVMEAVDPEVSVTCLNLAHVRKTFQLALLCTKRHPSERPTMHDVARALVSLLPVAPPTKLCLAPTKPVDYAQFVVGKGLQSRRSQFEQQPRQETNSSDAQWFCRFREAISMNTL
ncbi:hypothetical protein V6N13_070311 [Hibiscus sabdariffa]